MRLKDDVSDAIGGVSGSAVSKLNYSQSTGFLSIKAILCLIVVLAFLLAMNSSASAVTDSSYHDNEPAYIFDDPIGLANKINSRLAPIMGTTTLRLINGGILSEPDLQEWRRTMGKEVTAKYQQAFYKAFAGDIGPVSIANVRTTNLNGRSKMNCIISHPSRDWHAIWDAGGVNMSMKYGDKNYNLNDVSTFILYHESKHCLSGGETLYEKENKSDAFAALMHRREHGGDIKMLLDIRAFRQHQLDSTADNYNPKLLRAAQNHDSRDVLSRVMLLDYRTQIKGRSVIALNRLANFIVNQSLANQ